MPIEVELVIPAAVTHGESNNYGRVILVKSNLADPTIMWMVFVHLVRVATPLATDAVLRVKLLATLRPVNTWVKP